MTMDVTHAMSHDAKTSCQNMALLVKTHQIRVFEQAQYQSKAGKYIYKYTRVRSYIDLVQHVCVCNKCYIGS